MRDKLKDKAYFDQWVDYAKTNDDRVKGKLDSLNAESKARRSSNLVGYAYSTLTLRYGRGDFVLEMFSTAQQGYEALKLRRIILSSIKDKLEPATFDMWERLDLGALFEYSTILSFMVALHFPNEEIADALKQIGHEGEDVLLDLVASYIGQGKGTKKSAFPKVYGDLTILLQAEKEKRPLLLKHCLNNWYESMKPIYWYDSHNGGEGAYEGYWCFDIALVVMLLDIDDSLVQDHPHYPADLVKHYRATK
ncbi:MAG: DUF1911 domain-containing protein [Azoarcus sp.]|jgi:hypothetical protein|nr:DUF1911 domain-containing protein [Azoarcus sp.]